MEKQPPSKTMRKRKDTTQKKRSRKQMMKENAPKRKRKKRAASESESDGDEETPISLAVYTKWKPMSASTKTFVNNILNQSVNIASERIDAQSAHHLTNLKKRINNRISNLKVPVNKLGDYKKAVSLANSMEALMEQYANQVKVISQEIERQERLIDNKHDEKLKLEKQLAELHLDEEIEPLEDSILAGLTNELHLPALSEIENTKPNRNTTLILKLRQCGNFDD